MQIWLQTTQQQLSRQMQTGKLPHAFLFTGVKGAGHEELALWLTQVLLCQRHNIDSLGVLHACKQCKTCKLFASNTYPDHITLSTDKATIGVDEIRSLSHFFEKTAHIGKTKTALVKQADIMTVSAANALLKTLEEPTSNRFIILTSHRAETLLPTIISRCQKIEIRPPVGEKLLSAFALNNTEQSTLSSDQESADLFVNLSHYSELSDLEVASQFQVFRHNVEQYLCSRQQRAEILKVLVDDNNGMRWLEKIIVDLTRNQQCWNETRANSARLSLDGEQLWQIYRLVQTVNRKMKTLVQANQQFIVEKLLIDITHIANRAEG